MYSVACVGGKKVKRGRVLGLGKDLKKGQLTLGKGPATMGIHKQVQGAAIPSKKSFLA
jgi:hypothetical protein